ncbi:MAG TPA: hypothetical protein VIC26_03310, partial [Marinagarivorans sp.]
MNFLFNLRISQKIMALVAGLCVGFIAIGIAYFVQINLQTQQAKERAELSQLQGAMVLLATQSGRLGSGAASNADIESLLASLNSNKELAQSSELKNVTDLVAQYVAAGKEQDAAVRGLADSRTQLESSADLLRDAVADPLAYSQLRAAELAYRAQPNATAYENVFDRIALVSGDLATPSQALLNDYSAAFEAYAYGLKNQQVL